MDILKELYDVKQAAAPLASGQIGWARIVHRACRLESEAKEHVGSTESPALYAARWEQLLNELDIDATREWVDGILAKGPRTKREGLQLTEDMEDDSNSA